MKKLLSVFILTISCHLPCDLTHPEQREEPNWIRRDILYFQQNKDVDGVCDFN